MPTFVIHDRALAAPALDALASFGVECTIREISSEPRLAEYSNALCGGLHNILVVSDSRALVDPKPADIAHYFGKGKTEDERSNFDALILGAGPAGMTAAIYLSRANLCAAVIEEMIPGGLMTKTDEIENYPGFPEPVNGFELSMRMEQQARRFGTHFLSGKVERVLLTTPLKEATFAGRSVWAPNIVIATGTAHRKMGVPGEDENYGRGVSYCATCDGPLFRDKVLTVVGGGDSAIQEALFLSKLASKVKIVHRRDELRAEKILQERAFGTPNIEFVWNSTPVEVVSGPDGVTGLKVRNKLSGEESVVPCDGVFVFIGLLPRTGVNGFDALGRDDNGFLLATGNTATDLPGVFVAGDLRSGNYRQIATAVGDGASASHEAETHLMGLDLPSLP